jgi:hypothetical protein
MRRFGTCLLIGALVLLAGCGSIKKTTVPPVQRSALTINVVAYASQSDVVRAPFPITAPIEGWPADCTGGPGDYVGDQNVPVLDRNACMH